MSFIINQNFALKSPQFNFARDYFASLADLKAASESDFPDHFITNVAGDLYQLTKSNSVDSNTGKWRKVKLGSDVNLSGYATTASLNSHTTNKSNPHGVTKSQVGLSNVDNTSDKAKPISTATQNALDTKANKSELDVVKNTYATKSEISALTSALVYKGTVDAKYALPTKNVKIGDVYVVAAAGTFAGQTCEPGDMIIAQTASNAEGTPAPTWTVVQTNINGAVTSTNALADNTLVLGNNNRAIKASSGNGFVKVINGAVSYDNNVVTASDTLDTSKLIVGSGGKGIHAANGTGFVKIADGIVSADNSTYLTTTSASNTYAKKTDLSSYLTSVPKATTSVVGGGKVVNVYNATAELTNTDPTASNVTLYGLQIDKDGNFYTPVKNAATYSLPAAADGKLGGIALGYSQTGKNYAVKLDNNNKAYVSVPWTDNNTTYPLASESINGLMSSSDKAKLNRMQYPVGITTSQLDLCGYDDAKSLVNAVANQKDGLSFFVVDQNAIVTLQTDNSKHAIIQTIRTAATLNNSWEFNTGAIESHTDGVLFTCQRFYPISGTYSTDIQNKWTKWAIIDVDTMYTANRSDMNNLYTIKGKQLLSNLTAGTDGKITFSSVYSGIDKNGIKSESKEILTPISETTIIGLF